MASVYILYSQSLDRYYTGSCYELENRFQEHLDKKFKDSYTVRADDWKLAFSINSLKYEQARLIERHIKAMKSKIYISNLIKYPEMTQRLIQKYSV